MSRVESTFKSLKSRGKTALLAFLTVGFPERASTIELAQALVEGGADVLELGIPFSDPLADGTTIQRSNQVALNNGVTVRDCLDAARELRAKGVKIPLLFMGYYNPLLHYGLPRFCADASAAGADGIIAVDLPPEEAADLRKECVRRNLDLIFLLAPTSTDQRIASVCKAAIGFVYIVSVAGVTGARASVSTRVPELVARVRKHTRLPLAVGFGVSSAEQFRSIGQYADGVAVGSAIISAIEKAPRGQRAAAAKRFVKQLKA